MPIKLSGEVKAAIIERTRKYRRTLKATDYLDPRAVFTNDDDREEYRSHDAVLQKNFPALTHNQRIILILFYCYDKKRDEILTTLRISKRTYYDVIFAFKSYDSQVHPVELSRM